MELYDFAQVMNLEQGARSDRLVFARGLTLAINANPAVEKEMLHYIAACDAPR
jgi:hypothetical protein